MKTVLRIVLVLSLCLCISAFLGTNAFAEEILVIHDDDMYEADTQYYEITLSANGGFYGNDPSSVLKTTRIREGSSFYGGSYRPTHPNPRMIFTGWYYDPECAQLAVSRDGSFIPDSDLTLYAGWSEGWIVTFDANGGQFGSGASTLRYAVPKGSTLSYSPYVRSADSDYEWDYWALEDGTRIDEWDFIPEGDVALYAHYSRLYCLTLDANGGYFYNDPSSALTATLIREGSSFYGGDYHPTNLDPHMFFTGWYYDAACTSLAAARDGSFTPNTDLTLYAGWSQGYAVIFETNDDTWVPKPQTKIPGETLVLRWDAPRREGFYFLGWAENADAETATYLPGENYTQDADVTLYALWGNPDFVLPDGLTEIEEEAFAGAAARFVKLPDSLASVGPRAFAGCTELQYIVIPDYLNQIDFSAFEGTENVIVLTFSQFRRLYRLPDYIRMMAP